MSRCWRRTTSRHLGPLRTWASKYLDSTSSTTYTHTYWTLQRSDMAIHKQLVYQTKAVISNKLITAGHSCFQWTWLHEEWLTDIETAADLTSESRVKLANAKSRGLTCTLLTASINSDKSWVEIKDLLRLKLCSANIHTYTSCFMEIHQWEKESPAVYIHWFKTEVKGCNFTNDAATIRIFIKGLKNAHSLATHIYEKGPQTLIDAISKVEKFNVVQQLTAMIIPPSTENMMSNEEDHCFQCQEQGHIAWNCPNITCFECDYYGHIVMDCPHMIPPLGTPGKHHQPRLHRSCHARSSLRHHQ